MNAPTDIQIIKQNGMPAFVVVPYDEYIKLFPEQNKNTNIPHEVVGLIVKKNYNLLKAWRTYLGLTQKKVAQNAGISQAALSQMERANNPNRDATLQKIAKALGLDPDQLMD